MLRKGLMEWSGPAHCTEDFAIAMGFTGAKDMPVQCSRIRSALVAEESLEPMDWARALLATEIALASDVVDSGYEWSTTTGWSDEVTVKTLRAIQRRLVRLVAKSLGTRPLNL